MLYAVSVETTQVLPIGRARRRTRLLVEAKNNEDARRLAEARFRHRPEIKSCVASEVTPVKPQAAPELAPAQVDVIRLFQSKSRRQRSKKRGRGAAKESQ